MTISQRAAPLISAAGYNATADLTTLLNSLLAVVEPLVSTAVDAISHGDPLYRNTYIDHLRNAGQLASLASLISALDARVIALETP